MNKLYDIIIIGDSPEGIKVLKRLASASCKINVAFVSRLFKSTTTRDYLNVEYIRDEVVLLDYKTKLFGCYLKSGTRLYSTHIIIASGVKYAPYLVNGRPVPDVFNTPYDISNSAKSLPAVVVGRDNAAVKLALAVAKKYRQVYLCMDALSPDCSDATAKKLEAAANIVQLPNAEITRVHTAKGKLDSVELSNYSQITCKAIFVKTATRPETDFIPKQFVEKDAKGYCIISKAAESTLVPGCFVVGSCTTKCTAKQIDNMINKLLIDFVEV